VFKLSAKSPCEGLLPLSIGPYEIREMEFANVTLIAPKAGQEEALDVTLSDVHRLKRPQRGRITGRADLRCLYLGPHLALLGAKASDELASCAHLTDVSDGYCFVQLSGPDIPAVLAMLCPIDLAKNAFKRGHAQSTLIGHMQGTVARLGEDGYLLGVFRSMAKTLVYEISRACSSVNAIESVRERGS